MFRGWRASCENLLKRKNNQLLIVFESAVNKGRQMAKMLPYTLPGDEKVFTRKAQYQYGWDWGPRFVTCGIWRPVRIEVWNEFRVSDVHITTNTFNENVAKLTAAFEIVSDVAEVVKIEVQNTYNSDDAKIKSFRLKPGVNVLSLDFRISKPVLWWCNGQGAPFMYPILVSVKSNNGSHFEKVIPYGIRKIELVREADSIGESFFFRLNGRNIFAKGANYIPPDNFMPRVDSANFAAMLDDALACHMNMLRVWGGGNYESDLFYRLCDEKGILIWQDMMFACAMVPGDSAFIDNVKKEVTENICRLRNHACIALWCGNNEIDEGWHNWGWQKQYAYTSQDSSAVWNDYVTVFQKMIPEIASHYSPETPYISSSPQIGWGRNESMQRGDSHYWGVWWGMEPFTVYEKKVPRFMSEYGFQGMPDMATISSFTDSVGRQLFSEDLKSHQKHPTGFETIKSYMALEYPVPADLADFNYISQLLQANGVQRAIEAHRRAMPRCMGSLYWQFNDCWPVVSWSGRDYYGRWKALQYAVRNAFADPMISVFNNSGTIQVFLVSDTASCKGTLNLSLIRFDGTVLWSRNIDAQAKPGASQIVFEMPVGSAIKDSSLMKSCLLSATFNYTGELKTGQLIKKFYFFTEPKNLLLERPDINLKFTRYTDKFWEITLETGIFAKNICLVPQGTDAMFSDNYFDLLPNQKKTIQCIFNDTVSDPGTVIRIKSLYDIKQINQKLPELK
jgi:beta-mannosidase